ncbi:phage head closure protein [Pseudolactococcus raffinolactis]|uniref:phage head closure protein n=1 Tax=Pseudolactococcus raffinolactis TaxID=1366 RepID=UPI0028975DFA|nr:phage head closure protein [Lactococcus raffinolactis]
MWDLEVSLLQEDGYTQEKGKINKTIKYSETELLAYEKQIGRSELYYAGQSNIELTKIIVIHSFEYDNQQLVKIDGLIYQVINTYKINNEQLELKLKAKKGGV